eukprot:SAG22_NODE_486_length_9885_cov_2.043634_4_plen_375_part_00
MDFLSQRNLFRLAQLSFSQEIEYLPFTDTLFEEDAFFDLLDQIGCRYFFKWRYKEHVHDEQLFVDTFIKAYVNQYGGSLPFLDKLYTSNVFTLSEIKQIAATQVQTISDFEKEHTASGYFEKYICLCVDDHAGLCSLYRRYLDAFNRDELLSKERRFYKYKRQESFMVGKFEKIYEHFGKNFLFDFYELAKEMKDNEDFGYYRSLDTVLVLAHSGYIKFNHFFYVPQYQMDYEANLYKIVSYRIKMNIGLTEKWFVTMDPYFKKNLYVARQDFSMVKFLGKTYRLTDNQARFTLFLYQKITQSSLDIVPYNEILNFLEAQNISVKSVRDLFRIASNKTSPLYKTLVCFDSQHNYFLDKQFVLHLSFIPEFSANL